MAKSDIYGFPNFTVQQFRSLLGCEKLQLLKAPRLAPRLFTELLNGRKSFKLRVLRSGE